MSISSGFFFNIVYLGDLGDCYCTNQVTGYYMKLNIKNLLVYINV